MTKLRVCVITVMRAFTCSVETRGDRPVNDITTAATDAIVVVSGLPHPILSVRNALNPVAISRVVPVVRTPPVLNASLARSRNA